jgi:hypothetical protein
VVQIRQDQLEAHTCIDVAVRIFVVAFVQSFLSDRAIGNADCDIELILVRRDLLLRLQSLNVHLLATGVGMKKLGRVLAPRWMNRDASHRMIF